MYESIDMGILGAQEGGWECSSTMLLLLMSLSPELIRVPSNVVTIKAYGCIMDTLIVPISEGGPILSVEISKGYYFFTL
jgi:hypothetical protein